MVLSGVPMDLSTFWVVWCIFLKEEIPLVIDAVPFSLYVLQLMRSVCCLVFCAEICIKQTILDGVNYRE